jgi:hypothetical protein
VDIFSIGVVEKVVVPRCVFGKSFKAAAYFFKLGVCQYASIANRCGVCETRANISVKQT